MLVLLVHSAFASNGYPKELNDSTLWLVTLESISIIGVNVFIFISGYFSIKLKPKTIYSLVITAAFYFCLLTGISLAMGEPLIGKNLLFLSNSHYFIIDYLGLALLSPILNKFAETVSKKELAVTIITLFIYQTWFACITGVQETEFDHGYSLMSFSIIYLMARYVKINGVPKSVREYSGILYVVCTLLMIIASVVGIKMGYPGLLYRIFAYNDPLVIASSIFFFIYFEKMDIGNNRVINHVAKSTLGILLFHAAIPAVPTVWRFMKQTFSTLAKDIDIINMFYWGGLIIVIALTAILVDQLRLFIIGKLFRTTNK